MLLISTKEYKSSPLLSNRVTIFIFQCLMQRIGMTHHAKTKGK